LGEEGRDKLSVGKTEGKGPLGGRRHWRVDNIEVALGEIGFGGIDGICLADARDKCRFVVNLVLNLRVP
jgi:hypothetical protein